MAAFTPEAMRARFKEAVLERDRVLELSTPVRAQRDVLQAQIAELERQMEPLTEQIRAIEAPLFDLQMELGIIARALGGKTGDPYEVEAPTEPPVPPT